NFSSTPSAVTFAAVGSSETRHGGWRFPLRLATVPPCRTECHQSCVYRTQGTGNAPELGKGWALFTMPSDPCEGSTGHVVGLGTGDLDSPVRNSLRCHHNVPPLQGLPKRLGKLNMDQTQGPRAQGRVVPVLFRDVLSASSPCLVLRLNPDAFTRCCCNDQRRGLWQQLRSVTGQSESRMTGQREQKSVHMEECPARRVLSAIRPITCNLSMPCDDRTLGVCGIRPITCNLSTSSDDRTLGVCGIRPITCNLSTPCDDRTLGVCGIRPITCNLSTPFDDRTLGVCGIRPITCNLSTPCDDRTLGVCRIRPITCNLSMPSDDRTLGVCGIRPITCNLSTPCDDRTLGVCGIRPITCNLSMPSDDRTLGVCGIRQGAVLVGQVKAESRLNAISVHGDPVEDATLAVLLSMEPPCPARLGVGGRGDSSPLNVEEQGEPILGRAPHFMEREP
ncbi:hypothetical protein P4O66_013188, partial [Electrophorus voltai]